MGETTVVCKVCGRRCGGPAGLSSHMRSMHAPRAPIGRAGEAPPADRVDDGELIWEEPPAGKHGPVAVEVALAPKLVQLKERPKEWARLRTFPKRTSGNSAQTRLRKRCPGYEFRSGAHAGGSALWGRYVGGEE